MIDLDLLSDLPLDLPPPCPTRYSNKKKNSPPNLPDVHICAPPISMFDTPPFLAPFALGLLTVWHRGSSGSRFFFCCPVSSLCSPFFPVLSDDYLGAHRWPRARFGGAILVRCGSRPLLGDFFNDSENQNRYSTMYKLNVVDIHTVALGSRWL